MPGPPPKRQAERRRRNKDVVETQTVDLSQTISQEVVIPVANEDWHPVAIMLWESLPKSGQSQFYEPSDWAAAYLMVESISRDLEEQVVGITESGEVIRAEIPMKGASLSAYLKLFGSLMMTEGDRRKIRMEIERANAAAKSGEPTSSGNVIPISQSRTERFRRDA